MDDLATNCWMSLPEAMRRFVHDGDCVALEGFTHLIPFAAGQELIRQGRCDLHLVRMTPDLIYDQMIGMGCARRLSFSWGGNPGVGYCIDCVTPSSTTGHILWNSTSTATQAWLQPTQQVRPDCRSVCCAAIRGATYRNTIHALPRCSAPTPANDWLVCPPCVQM